jgi:hypothetical protein
MVATVITQTEINRVRHRGAMILFLLQFVDITTTTYMLQRGKSESNPIAAFFIHNIPGGMGTLFAAKIIICLMILFGTFYQDEKRVSTLTVTCALYAVIGFYSLGMIINSIGVVYLMKG